MLVLNVRKMCSCLSQDVTYEYSGHGKYIVSHKNRAQLHTVFEALMCYKLQEL
jgi:hypothetical protein